MSNEWTIRFPGGGAVLRPTPWDERALGFPTVEIVAFDSLDEASAGAGLSRVVNACREGGTRYVFGRFAPELPVRRALEDHGFALVETSLSLSASLPCRMLPVPKAMRVELVPVPLDLVAELRLVAERDFHHGRFLEDPLIDAGAARTRNGNWLADLVAQGLVWAGQSRTGIVGFHAERVHLERGSADLILTGVAHKYSVFAPALWSAALARLRESGIGRCQTMVSAANLGVVNLYSSLGFRVDAVHLGYRRFL